jgi:tripartite-type tricarboxylate transporter receptor subunit TctC
MILVRCRRALALAGAVVGLLGSSEIAAQGYPTRAVKIVVPFPAGGPVDFTARLVAESLQASLKQPFVIENRSGAGGNIGTEAVAKADPDGHTLLLVLETPLTVNPALYKQVPFVPDRDLEPISIVATFHQMLVVHPAVPANSVTEFVALAKQSSLTYGSGGGKGSPGHLAMEYFLKEAGIRLVHVPYKGNADVVSDLVGGHIQAGFVATPGVGQLAKDGKLKGLAVSDTRRTPLAPEVPTVAESGFPGFDIGFCIVMLAPKGTPEPIRAVLEQAVHQVLSSSATQERLRGQDLEPVGNNGEEAKTWLKTSSEKWRQLIHAANLHD